MKKLALTLTSLGLFFMIQFSYADTVLNYSPLPGPTFTTKCPDESGTPDGYGNSRMKFGIPQTNGGGSAGSSSVTCNTHYYYSSADANVTYTKKNLTNSPGTSNTTGVTNCPAGQMVIGWSGIEDGGTMICRNYDDLPPNDFNITGATPSDGSNLLATSSQNFSISISNGGGSPITLVRTFFEDYTTANTLKSTATVCTSNCNENISNVDLNRTTGGGRTYTLRVSQVCDEAGNCAGGNVNTSVLADFNYNVYANPLATGGSSVRSVISEGLSNSSNVADGTTKAVTVRLRDAYGNGIVTATGISRTVDIAFTANNSMYLNQYTRSGQSSIFTTSGNGTDYSNKFPIGNNNLKFLSQTSTDGDYVYGFKGYTPTSNQGYGGVSDISSQFNISDMSYFVNGSLGNLQNQTLSNGAITTTFNPLYYTTISGEIKDQGFIEGAVQGVNILVSKNSSVTTGSNNLRVEFGSGDTNSINPKLNLFYGSSSPSTYIGEGNGSGTIINSNFSTGSYVFVTKLLSVPGSILSDLQKSYFSTHFSYTLDGYAVNYNSSILGKTSYWGTMGFGNVTQSAIKILGNIYNSTNSYNEIISGQDGNNVKRIVGNISKTSLKSDMRVAAYKFIKNISTPAYSSQPQILNLSTFADSVNNGVAVSSGKVLYYGGLASTNRIVELGNGSNLIFSGKKSIIVEGGDLYIKSNITYTNTGSDILGIVVLKDKNGNGGNLFIDPSVTKIFANIYADNAIISYNGNELDGDTNFAVLKNQLYIYGSIFSENTIGGSRLAKPKCPYYIDGSTCDLKVAQKYDLNYLRRYYLTDTNNDGVPDSPAGSGIQVKGGTYASYPVIIEYNPKIQTNPPPLFTY